MLFRSSAVQGQAPAERIQREVVMASGDGPLVLRLKSGALERTRIYSPQAFGGCGDGAL